MGNCETFFSFLGKDCDQTDHYDDQNPRVNVSFLPLLSPLPSV